MRSMALRVHTALEAAGVVVTGVSVGDESDKATWKVQPPSLQSAAQPTIDAFDPNDPAHEQAELDADVKAALDTERLASAMVWAIIDTYSAPATPTKYRAARQKIIEAYRTRPWAQ